MAETDLKVHGSIFYLLKKFVIGKYSTQTWENILKKAGLIGSVYDMTGSYSLSEMGLLIGSASEISGKTIEELKELFGEYMVPDLFVLYHNYLNPAWKTFDLLENTERIMHGAVRRLNSTANPPILSVAKVNPNLLIIDYYSKRRMGSLAVGIIRGIATFYDELDKIQITSLSDPNDERVQIKVIHD